MFLSAIQGNRDNSSTDKNLRSSIVSKEIKVDPEILGGNVWITKATGGAARQGLAGFNVNGFGYICNGNTTGTAVNEINQYNDSANSWATKATGGTARDNLTGFRLNGFGYICCGFGAADSNEVNKYNDSANSWATKATAGTARYGLTGFDLNGFGYVCEGSYGIVYTNEVNQYNDSLDSWTIKASGIARISPASFSLNGFGYVCNGYDNTNLSNAIQQYNDVTNSWATKATGGTARYYLAGFSLNGLGYLCNGSSASGKSSEVDQYDNFANIWVIKAPGGTARQSPAGLGLNGFGYACNGFAASDSSEVNQYRPTNMYYMGRFKSSAKTPSKVLVATNCNGYAKTLPIWIRTDGTNWKYMESNVDSLVKQGTTVTGTLATTGGYYQYELTVGLPPTWIGTGASGGGGAVGGGYWVAKAQAGVNKNSSAGFSLNGYGYICGGVDGLYISAVIKYDNDSNAWTTKASISEAI